MVRRANSSGSGLRPPRSPAPTRSLFAHKRNDFSLLQLHHHLFFFILSFLVYISIDEKHSSPSFVYSAWMLLVAATLRRGQKDAQPTSRPGRQAWVTSLCVPKTLPFPSFAISLFLFIASWRPCPRLLVCDEDLRLLA